MPRDPWEGRPATGSLARRPRPGESLRDKLFYFGVAAVFTALSVGAAYVSPVLVYDCARQASGSVDCTVHRRMYGVIPRGDLRFTRILSVDVKSGVYSETMSERSDRIRAGRKGSSWEALVLVCADGTNWQSPDSSWPLGKTPSDHRMGLQELLDADSAGTYRGWTGEKVTLIVALAFLVPAGLLLLGLVLRLLIPRSFVEESVSAMEAAAARRRQAP